MGKKRRKSRRERQRRAPRRSEAPLALTDRRIAAATRLAEDIPAAPGLPVHKKGAAVIWDYVVEVEGLGRLAFHAPLPSELLLHVGSGLLYRAMRSRRTALAGTKKIVGVADRSASNYHTIFDFFQQAMAGIVLVHAALNNFANERIPREFVLVDGDRRFNRDQLIDRGIEYRVSRVLGQVTGGPNLKSDRPELWTRFLALKELRDDIEHARDTGAGGHEVEKEQTMIFARLLNGPDLSAHAQVVREIIDLYRPAQSAGEKPGPG